MTDDERADEHIDDVVAELDAGEVVAALAATVAVAPPRELHARLLAAAAARPRPRPEVATPADVYTARVAALAALLDDLGDDEWDQPATPYAWTVHGLVAHLVVIEEHTARRLGLDFGGDPATVDDDTVDHLALGADTIATLLDGDPATTVARWRRASERIVAHVRAIPPTPGSRVRLHGWVFDAPTALVVRAFELWTHADDIRRATGRPLDAPAASELQTMSTTSVRGLPLLVTTELPAGVATPVRVVLTGPGGGTFDLGPAPTDDRAERTVLVTDVLDYCRLVARRVAPGELVHERTGRADLVDALLRVASAIAV